MVSASTQIWSEPCSTHSLSPATRAGRAGGPHISPHCLGHGRDEIWQPCGCPCPASLPQEQSQADRCSSNPSRYINQQKAKSRWGRFWKAILSPHQLTVVCLPFNTLGISRELLKSNLFSLQMNTGLDIGTRWGGWEGARGVFREQIPTGSGCCVELGCICHIWLDCVVLFYLPDLSYDSSVFMWHFLGNITAWIIYSECFPSHKTSRLQRVFICTVMFSFCCCCCFLLLFCFTMCYFIMLLFFFFFFLSSFFPPDVTSKGDPWGFLHSKVSVVSVREI